MTVIIASISDYAMEYIEQWAAENGINTEKALDEIISSVRRDSENG